MSLEFSPRHISFEITGLLLSPSSGYRRVLEAGRKVTNPANIYGSWLPGGIRTMQLGYYLSPPGYLKATLRLFISNQIQSIYLQAQNIQIWQQYYGAWQFRMNCTAFYSRWALKLRRSIPAVGWCSFRRSFGPNYRRIGVSVDVTIGSKGHLKENESWDATANLSLEIQVGEA